MCSALARNENCCKRAFRGASSLFTVSNPRCDGLDKDDQVLSGYMVMDVQYCGMSDDQLKSELFNETSKTFIVFFSAHKQKIEHGALKLLS